MYTHCMRHFITPSSLCQVQSSQNLPFLRLPLLRRCVSFILHDQTALLAQFRKGKKSKLTVGNAWKSFKDEGPLREVLFWSGGKDSLLALRALQQDQRETGCEVKITLLTTYDGDTGNIPFQDTKASGALLHKCVKNI